MRPPGSRIYYPGGLGLHPQSLLPCRIEGAPPEFSTLQNWGCTARVYYPAELRVHRQSLVPCRIGGAPPEFALPGLGYICSIEYQGQASEACISCQYEMAQAGRGWCSKTTQTETLSWVRPGCHVLLLGSGGEDNHPSRVLKGI